MANISLKDIQFPGLNNKYTVPEVDNTLTQSGEAADAKKTGDELGALKEDLIEFEQDVLPVLRINLFDMQDLLKAYGSVSGKWEYEDGYYYGKLGALAGTYGNTTSGLPVRAPFKENTQYSISITAHTNGGSSTSGNGLRVKTFYTDGSDQLMDAIPNNASADETVVSLTAEGKTVSKICATYGADRGGYWYVKDLRIVEGISTVYTAIDHDARNGILELTERTLSSKGRLTESADTASGGTLLDELPIGCYWKETTEAITNGVNTHPACVLSLVPSNGTSNRFYRAQLWFDVYDCILYYRTKTSSGNPWKSWKKLDDPEQSLNLLSNNIRKNFTRNGFIFRLSSDPESVPVGENHISYADFITLWDNLAAEINAKHNDDYQDVPQTNNYADTVTKTKIGVSTTTEKVTTEYDIFQYVFEPRDAEFTVLLTSGGDGNEYESYWSLYRFMYTLYHDAYKYPNIRDLHHRIRFVVVPIWNPFAMDNNRRTCALGFQALDNLNKEATGTVDGVSTTYPAFTSKECQAIRDCIDGLQANGGKVDLWLDLHTDPFSYINGYKKGFYGYAPDGMPINKSLYGLIMDFDDIIYDETGSETLFTLYNTSTSANAGMPGYGTGRGIPTALIEMTIGEFQQAPNDPTPIPGGSAQIMKYAQEWYWNVISNLICAF